VVNERELYQNSSFRVNPPIPPCWPTSKMRFLERAK